MPPESVSGDVVVDEDVEHPIDQKRLIQEDANLDKLKKLYDEKELVESQIKELQATVDDHNSSKET